MIGYLEGKLLKLYEDRILLLSGQVGYEIILPPSEMEKAIQRGMGETFSLYIYWHQTERQPKPVLIGFTDESEKEFFLSFISVEDIGPLKAVKALTLPVAQIARAIESGDTTFLKQLKGVGGRTAQKIVASLKGKMAKFAFSEDFEKRPSVPVEKEAASGQVAGVLVNQLGYKLTEARQLISQALDRKPDISTPEELFEEVFRGEKGS